MNKKIFTLAVPAVILPVLLAAPGRSSKTARKPFYGVNFAHRGLYERDMSIPENSLAAFRRAAENGYGIELDVQLSRDGQVVVFHDDDLKRVCGVDMRVDEVDFEELNRLSLCGTGETVPLFSRVLDVVNGRTPIIVELKTGRRNRELCEKTYALLSAYRGDVCVESFNPLIMGWFRFHGKDLLRGQLAMPVRYYEGQKLPVAVLLGSCLMNFVSRPQFIAYRIGPRPLTVRLSELMGAMRVGWTSHEAKNEKGRDAVIFEFYKPSPKYK